MQNIRSCRNFSGAEQQRHLTSPYIYSPRIFPSHSTIDESSHASIYNFLYLSSNKHVLATMYPMGEQISVNRSNGDFASSAAKGPAVWRTR